MDMGRCSTRRIGGGYGDRMVGPRRSYGSDWRFCSEPLAQVANGQAGTRAAGTAISEGIQMTDIRRVIDTLETAKRFNLTLEELIHATSFAESVNEWQRVVNDLVVAGNG